MTQIKVLIGVLVLLGIVCRAAVSPAGDWIDIGLLLVSLVCFGGALWGLVKLLVHTLSGGK